MRYIIPVPVRGFGLGPATNGLARGDGERGGRDVPGLALRGESVGVRVGERGVYGCCVDTEGWGICPVLCDILPVDRDIEMVRARAGSAREGLPFPNVC